MGASTLIETSSQETQVSETITRDQDTLGQRMESYRGEAEGEESNADGVVEVLFDKMQI